MSFLSLFSDNTSSAVDKKKSMLMLQDGSGVDEKENLREKKT